MTFTILIATASYFNWFSIDAALAADINITSGARADSVMTLVDLVSTGSINDLSTYLENVSEELWLQKETTEEAILQAVAQRCRIEIIILLKEYGFELSTKQGSTLFHQLAFIEPIEKSIECMDTLIQAGLDINAVDKKGHTALIDTLYSHQDGALTVLEGLLSRGADPTIRSDLGLDLLHHALLLRLLYTEVVTDGDSAFNIKAREMIQFAEQVSHLVTSTYSSSKN